MHAAYFLHDNPVLWKHFRSRLRRSQVLPWVFVLLILCFLIIWVSQQAGSLEGSTPASTLLFMQVVILVFMGAHQVSSAIGGARASGIMDFHRVTPLHPFALVLGFFLGAPIREYLLYAVTLPFAGFLAMVGTMGWENFLQSEIALIFSAWVFHAVTMLGSLTSRKPRGGSSRSIGVLVVMALVFGQIVMRLVGFASRGFSDVDTETIAFFGIPLPWLLFVVLYQTALIGIFLLASTRKMRAEKAHAYSKLQAVGVMALITTLVLGLFWSYQAEPPVLITVYGLMGVALLLATTITPGQAEYLRGVRRAEKQGRRRPSLLDDAATNRLGLYGLCACVFLGATFVWMRVTRGAPGNPSAYSSTIAVAVFVVAYFGLGLQYFQFRMRKQGAVMMGLFLFLFWVVPIILGLISMATFFGGAGSENNVLQFIFGLSPISSIAFSSNLGGFTGSDTLRLAALAPAIGFAALFHFLLVALQRRLDRSVLTGAEHHRTPFDYLVKDEGNGQVGQALSTDV